MSTDGLCGLSPSLRPRPRDDDSVRRSDTLIDGMKLVLLTAAALLAGYSNAAHSPASTPHATPRPSSTSVAPSSTRWRTFSYQGVFTFKYPTSWYTATYCGVGSSAAAPLVAISDVPIGRSSSWPCQSSPSFSPGAVSATFSDVANDGLPLHPNTTVEGRKAYLVIEKPAVACAKGLSDAQSIWGLIPRDPGNFIGLTACSPASGGKADRNTVLATFESVHIA